MATKERKYKGSLTLGRLEIACEAEEQSYGNIIKIEAVGGVTVATYDDANFPPLHSLSFMPSVGAMPTPAEHSATRLFDGAVTVLGVAMDVAVFRTA